MYANPIGRPRTNNTNKLFKPFEFFSAMQKPVAKEKNLMHASNKKIFIGEMYQARLPTLLDEAAQERERTSAPPHECQLWVPSDKVSDEKINTLISELKPKGFDEDQILPFLREQKYDIDATLTALNNNFFGKEDRMPLHDKVLFNQGYGFHGKNFERIRDLVPNHSIQALINYYYTEFKRTKLNRAMTTVRPEFEVKKLASQEASKAEKAEGSKGPGRTSGTDGELATDGNGLYSSGNIGSTADEDEKSVDDEETDETFADQDSRVSENVSSERTALQQLIQDQSVAAEELKKIISPVEDVEEQDADLLLKEARAELRKDPTPVWQQDEIMIFMRGLVEFGLDFARASKLLPTKTEQQMRNFYYNRSYYYRLDTLIKIHDEREKFLKEKTKTN